MKKLLFTLCLLTGWVAMTYGQTLPWPPESPAPDSYGYTWKTNSAAGGPTFNWIDITTVGTKVEDLTDDNFVGPFPMGIDFPFYWLTKSQLWIGSNGFISFQPANISSTAIGFPPPPTADGNEDLIAPYLSDLSFAGNNNPGEAWYYSDAAENRFIVSFLNVPYWTNNTAGYDGSNSFQVILDADDSTITFQYLDLTGDWNSSYNSAANPFVVGIEAITGNIGLSVPEPPVNTAKKPVDSTAITFYAPSTPGPVVDAAVTTVGNRDLAGYFLPWAPPASTAPTQNRLSAGVTNQGSADINTTIYIEASVKDTSGNLFYFLNDSIPGGLAVGESQGFFFTPPFYPPFSGSYRYIIEITNPQDFGDVNTANDIGETEIVMVDTTLDEITLGYVSDDINNALTSTPINWSGNNGASGAAVFFDPVGYPVELIAVEFRHVFLTGDTLTQGFAYTVNVLDSANSTLPGTALAGAVVPLDSVPLAGGWTRINLDSPIKFDSGGFYVAWYQNDPRIVLATEQKLPISRRTYEILDGDWSVYRQVNTQDIWIRAVVKIDSAVFVGKEDLLDVSQFDVFPNPTQGMVNIDVKLAQPADMMIKVVNMEGRKVWVEVRPKSAEWNQQLDLSSLSPGIYMIQVLTPEGQKTKRLIKY
ncbi:MAG: T9SS type A sorting domain-containing protein [Bacteroidetes bacterium]|nr:T9SS type A sorting domain-containing protein [Bacteroidota bacterium]